MDGLGFLEQLQTPLEISIAMGFRFSLIGLGVIAVYTGIQEFKRLRSRKKPAEAVNLDPATYSVWFVNRILVALGVLLASPAGLYRLGASNLLNANLTFHAFQLACLCLIAYFILSELVRLRLCGMQWNEARWRTVPFAMGFVGLFSVGFLINPHS